MDASIGAVNWPEQIEPSDKKPMSTNNPIVIATSWTVATTAPIANPISNLMATYKRIPMRATKTEIIASHLILSLTEAPILLNPTSSSLALGYFLFNSSIDERKNVHLLIQSYINSDAQKSGINLVITGKLKDDDWTKIRDTIKKSNEKDKNLRNTK